MHEGPEDSPEWTRLPVATVIQSLPEPALSPLFSATLNTGHLCCLFYASGLLCALCLECGG